MGLGNILKKVGNYFTVDKLTSYGDRPNSILSDIRFFTDGIGTFLEDRLNSDAYKESEITALDLMAAKILNGKIAKIYGDCDEYYIDLDEKIGDPTIPELQDLSVPTFRKLARLLDKPLSIRKNGHEVYNFDEIHKNDKSNGYVRRVKEKPYISDAFNNYENLAKKFWKRNSERYNNKLKTRIKEGLEIAAESGKEYSLSLKTGIFGLDLRFGKRKIKERIAALKSVAEESGYKLYDLSLADKLIPRLGRDELRVYTASVKVKKLEPVVNEVMADKGNGKKNNGDGHEDPFKLPLDTYPGYGKVLVKTN